MTLEVVFNSTVLPYFIVMLIFLPLALIWLDRNPYKYNKCTLRKMFHILALILFTPLLV